MTTLMLDTTEEVEAPRLIRRADHPISFETFLQLNLDEDMELIDGVMVKKMAAQWEHERLLAWLFWLLFGYVQQRNLGNVAGSRTPVRINDFRSRLPDLLFIRQERASIIQPRAIMGAPDLVIELISPNDRISDLFALETDYRAIGVREIVFIDQQRQSVRLLRQRTTGYEETGQTAGELIFETVPGFVLQTEALFADPRPNEFDLLVALLAV